MDPESESSKSCDLIDQPAATAAEQPKAGKKRKASGSTTVAKKRKAATAPKPPKVKKPKKACGLCKKTKKLTKTECCNKWICDDEHKYRLFSFALNSCYRNHHRYSLCSYHHNESHPGRWQDCKICEENGGDDFEMSD